MYIIMYFYHFCISPGILQHAYWKAEPRRCRREELPSCRVEASHEMDMKQKRHAERDARNQARLNPTS